MILSTWSLLYFFFRSISSLSLLSSSYSFSMVISFNCISLFSFSFLLRNSLFLAVNSSSLIFSYPIYSSRPAFSLMLLA